MQGTKRLLALSLFFVLVLPPNGARAAQSDLSSLNLQLADLPRGFVVAANALLDNAAAAKEDHVAVSQEVKAGRLLSSEVTFMWAQGKPENGLFFVNGIVVRYDSNAHARAAYLKQAAVPLIPGGPRSSNLWRGLVTTSHAITSPAFARVGVQRLAWTWAVKVPLQNPPGGSIVTIYDTFIFYRGAYKAMVVTVDTGTHDPLQLARFARIVDERIRHAVQIGRG